MRKIATYGSAHGPTWLMDFRSLDEQLSFLRRQINDYRARPVIRDLAVGIVKDQAAERDKASQALACCRWVKKHIYYVLERPERFQTPAETLRLGAGDCDDFTPLIGAMIESIGIPSVMVTMRINMNWRHIFPAAVLDRKMLTLDAATRLDVTINPVTFMQARGDDVAIKLA